MNFSHSPNDTVLDRYTIRRGIGSGGFGEVYFALSQAGKEVALKRIQRNLAVELRGVSHCLNLKHPNLVSLHDVCRDSDNQTWVVMEYIAGKSLREVLDEANPAGRVCQATLGGDPALPSGLTLAEVRRWFCAMAAGTAHLHAAGLVHRDLKPGNLFDDDGIIKVGDYGLSKFISVSHRSGHTESVGTLHYMAPEIGRGHYGCEIDIYAIGIILFELLSGEVPFDGETHQEIIVKHLTDRPDLSQIPSEFRDVIAACLQKDPASRPSDIATMMSMTPWAEESSYPLSWSPLPGQAPPSDFGAVSGRSSTGATAAATSGSAAPPPAEASSAPGAGPLPPPPAAPPPQVVLSRPATEEPLARAIRNSFSDLRAWWQNMERSPGAKFAVAFATVLVLLVNTHWLLPFLSLIAMVYLPYYVIRHLVLQIAEPDTYMHAQPTVTTSPAGATVRPVLPTRLSKTQVRQMLRASLGQRSRLTLAAEWSTSGMISLVVAATLLLIAAVVGLRNSVVTPLSLAPYVWMACVIWIGSLGLLGVAKAWEASEGEGVTRRLTAALLGAAIGVMAYWLAGLLMVPLDQGLTREIDATALPETFYQGSGIPKAAAMMAHFAILFGLLRIWKPVDPLRRARLSLWAVSVGVVAEWIVHQMIPVPQPAGMLITGGIIMMAQMSAPWVKSDSVSSLIAQSHRSV